MRRGDRVGQRVRYSLEIGGPVFARISEAVFLIFLIFLPGALFHWLCVFYLLTTRPCAIEICLMYYLFLTLKSCLILLSGNLLFAFVCLCVCVFFLLRLVKCIFSLNHAELYTQSTLLSTYDKSLGLTRLTNGGQRLISILYRDWYNWDFVFFFSFFIVSSKLTNGPNN